MSNLVSDNNIVTFTSVNGQYQFTIKRKFLKNVYIPFGMNYPDSDEEREKMALKILSEESVYTLMNPRGGYNLYRYLHNDSGPALINRESGEEQYWLDGVNVTKQKVISLAIQNDIKASIFED